MPTKAKKSAPKAKLLSWPPAKTRTLLFILIVLFRSPGPLINVDQSSVIHQTFYNSPSKHDAETSTMNKTDPATIQQQLELWEAAAQRRHAEAQRKASADLLEELRQQAELLTSGASSYHLDSMTRSKQLPH
ncbi:hypothetical protein [Pseudomonas sp. GL93]|uniref:hypothetical protein n=1 Tax=Pseudomonas sp. GL93 TaxID=2014741 RepID=UPI000E31547F|nr:hypothetical protein [Pseudomonas sp. GL93]